LVALHEKEVSHNDLKPDNILATFDKPIIPGVTKINSFDDIIENQCRFLLGDFGLCTLYFDNTEHQFGKRGTPYFYSPEIWVNSRFNMKADVWAMGSLAVLLLTGLHVVEKTKTETIS